MAYLSERVSYIKGLMEGMNLDTTTNEGKLFKAIIDVLDDMAMSIEDTEETQDQIIENIEAMDERMDDLEEVVYEECDCCDDEDDEPFYCPECGEELPIDDLDIDETTESIVCPACKTEIELEWDDCEDGCGCCDCCGHDEE